MSSELSRTLPMRDAAGKVVLWIGSSTDAHEVEEADRRKDELLAMLGHELRNPLAPTRLDRAAARAVTRRRAF